LIRDIRITDQGQFAVQALQLVASASRLERVHLVNSGKIRTSGGVTIVDSSVTDAAGQGIDFAGNLTLDRVVLSGGTTALLSSTVGGTIDATNLLVYGTSGVAIDLSNASGIVRFTTVADSGTDAGTGPRAFICSGQVMVQSTIVWAPGSTSRVSIGPSSGADCPRSSTIAGPTPVAGASNDDPLFVDSANRDYHLAQNSPARDAVDIGPTFDFEGDPRPRGDRFDLGADETP
jgi:hypothetical protein